MNAPAPVEDFLDEKKSLACVHCGLCLSSCPTYLETGNENLSPRGRIYLMRALKAGRLELTEDSVKPIDLCLGCRACEVACPSGVQYGALLEQTRDHIEHRHQRGFFQRILRRFLIEEIFPVRWRMRLAVLPAIVLKKLGLDGLLPAFLRKHVDLLPKEMHFRALPPHSAGREPRKGRVAFIEGCVMPVLFQGTNRASIDLLTSAGYDVTVPEGQGCCGALFAHSGRLDRARDCARRNIAAFEKTNPDLILINAAGCGSTLKEYGHLLEGDPAWHERARQFSAKVRDLVEVLPSAKPASAPTVKVTYHDACHLAHAQRITASPRALLKNTPGVEFIDLPESDVCCGSAGSYNLTEPAMAERLQNRKINNIVKTGAEIVVTTNPGCLLQIQAGLNTARASHIRAMHIADFLAERASAHGP